MVKQTTRTPAVQWVVLLFVIVFVSTAMFLARDDPRMDWGPIILGALGLIGFMIRSLFKNSSDTDDDGYPK